MLGLGGEGNRSDVPELGGLKAERGRRGRVFGPLRRRPTWGGEGGLGICVLIVNEFGGTGSRETDSYGRDLVYKLQFQYQGDR